MNFSIDNKQTACFTGYRPKKFDFSDKKRLEEISVRLAMAIFSLLNKGYDTFLFGGAPGFDILAARAVLYAKKIKLDIRLICVLPYKDFHLSGEFDDDWKARYLDIINRCDGTVTLYDRYKNSCYMDRNKYMVDRSSHLICLYGGARGRTHNTVEYAKREGLAVSNILNSKG